MNLKHEFNRIGHLFTNGVEKTQKMTGDWAGEQTHQATEMARRVREPGRYRRRTPRHRRGGHRPPCAGKPGALPHWRRAAHRRPDREADDGIAARPAARRCYSAARTRPAGAASEPGDDLAQHRIPAEVVVRLVERLRDDDQRFVAAAEGGGRIPRSPPRK